MSNAQKRAAVADLYPGRGDVCERCRWQRERAKRSGSRRRGGLSESEGTAMRKRQQGDGAKTMPDCQIHAIYVSRVLGRPLTAGGH